MKKRKKASNINFILFLTGRMVSDTGTSVQLVIVPLYIIDAGGSASTVGLFSFLSILPALLIFPLAGVLGDRVNRKTIMVVTDIISAGVILVLASLSYMGRMNIAMLLTVQIIISLLNGLFDPATRGMLPQLVDQDELTRVNSKVATAKSISLLVGPVIGTLLYTKFGITMVFFVNGLSFLLSGASETLIGYVHAKRKAEEGISGVIKDLSDGFKFIANNKTILKLCFFFLVTYFFAQPIFGVVLPLFFKTELNYGDTQYGYLQMAVITGMLLASILVGIIFGKEKDAVKPLKFGCIMLAVNMLAFSLLTFPCSLSLLGNGSTLYFTLLAAVLCLFSGANIFISVPIQTYLQKETPEEFMSRVFSVVGMISKIGIPFGALAYGIILDRANLHMTVLVSALFMVCILSSFLTSILKDKGFS
ncbi:MFS transporter [Sedimentibacter hydroxybenzoicus DSM 7310]|uniref:MFS transporter n=1 Tax=Sedimentibacter hydroxybenzoicus DSM 7310 TaxID=1123245 RepID=A0A974BM37_SEDHY|nr:MFS transporter [Sedimentibacter hydroxybenzoicus]NYB75582.1 MFS transporter [Sedimentibacter hydroxybenzoicus DSM 7310]